jgi:hypothetical protein
MIRYTFLISLLCYCMLSLAQAPRLYFSHQHLNASTPGFPQLKEKARLGEGLACIGDLDGDGLEEIAVGAPGHGTHGAVFVLFLDQDNKVRRYVEIGQDSSGFDGKLSPQGQFGSRIKALGDWNGDSIPDLLVGEPQAQIGPINYGAVWLLLLNRDGAVMQSHHFSGRTEGLTGKLGRDWRFGSGLASLGDWDGDNIGDIAVGAPMLGNKGTGEVYILFLNAAGGIKKATQLKNGQNGFPKDGLSTGDQFGFSLCAYDSSRLYVGAIGEDEANINAGAIWQLDLLADGSVHNAHKITSGEGFTPVLAADDRWGSAITQVDDWNDDEQPELVVGAYRTDAGGRDKGKLYVLFPDSLGQVQYVNAIFEGALNFTGEFPAAYQWGRSLHIGADYNGDGKRDLLINGHLDDEGGRDMGSFWMVYPSWERPPEFAERDQRYPQKELNVSEDDLAWIFRNAETAEDSARIDSLYDLSSFAPSNLVFLLDVSASMRKPLRLPLLQEAFLNLLLYMRPEDKISIITYSGRAELELSGISASERDSISKVINNLNSSGGTKPAKALSLAYKIADSHFIEGGNNRIIFATDGGFETEKVVGPLTKNRDTRIPLSVFYFGKLPAFKIAEMENLARQGYGNTAHIRPETVEVALLNEVRVISSRQ